MIRRVVIALAVGASSGIELLAHGDETRNEVGELVGKGRIGVEAAGVVKQTAQEQVDDELLRTTVAVDEAEVRDLLERRVCLADDGEDRAAALLEPTGGGENGASMAWEPPEEEMRMPEKPFSVTASAIASISARRL